MSLSLSKPQNQPLIDYRGNDHEWTLFQQAVQNIPDDFDVPMIINGEEVRAARRFESINPATGEVICQAQQGDRTDASNAAEAALDAKQAWAVLSPEIRIQKFRDLEQLLYQRRHEISAVVALECGFNNSEVSGGWAEMMDFIRFNPYYYSRLVQTELGANPTETNQLLLRSLKGFTAAITPFNFPMAIGYNLPLVMALCGNTVVWKPSSDVPMSSSMLMQAIDDAGFPPGVINMITGAGAEMMAPVLEHSEITAVNFTGSFATARHIADRLFSSEIQRFHFPRLVAETGGKDFMVVDKSADVWDTAASIIAGAFGRSGQKCSATSLLLVDKAIWLDLRDAILEQLKRFRTGNPIERDCDMGPVINRNAFDKITGYIKRAQGDARVKTLCGGEFDHSNGFYIQPTIFEVAVDRHELMSDEIFGPVISVYRYDQFEDALEIIRNNKYRLTGAVCATDESFLQTAIPVLSEFAGNFYVNRKTTAAVVDQQPFGGDGASGTNYKAGGPWYLLQFISQGVVTRRHARIRKDASLWR